MKNFHRFHTTSCLMILLTLTPLSLAQKADSLIAEGDRAYHQFMNEEALNIYSQALKMDSSNFEAAWKLSRAYVDVGETLDDKDERKSYYKKGEEFSRKAIEIDSGRAEGHLYLSIALGRVALDAGAKERVRLSKEIKQEVDRALAIDSTNDIAWHVLGRWHRKIATLSWIEKKFANIFLGGVPKEASVEKSVECFRKAIELRPEHINHHLELGKSLEKLDRKNEAIVQYRIVLELPKKDADDDRYKSEATERLEDLQ